MANARVLNVIFHGIGTPARELEPGEDGYWITASQFEAILDEVRQWPAVRVSFDDSNSSDLTIALPALLERGLTADFFVLAGRFGAPGSLDAGDVRELVRSGMQVGTHGMHHRLWRGLDERARDEELVQARQQIADAIGKPVTAAACPLGQYDRGTLTAMKSLGYSRVYTSDRRPADPEQWLQPRYSVYRDDTPETMRARVLAGRSLVRQARDSAVGVIKRWR